MTTIAPMIANRVDSETLKVLRYSIYALHKELYQRYNVTLNHLDCKEGNADMLRIPQLHELGHPEHALCPEW